jgi:CheY-like chemotaxis protein
MQQAGKGRIMVIDDSETIRLLARRYLGEAGYQVLLCSDGIEALAGALAFAPQLIITDIQMKPLDGFETISLLRMNPALAAVPVAVSSSQGGVFDVARGKLLGVARHIVKPFRAEELLQVAAECIANGAALAHG